MNFDLDPQAQKILDLMAASDMRGFETMSPVAARFMFDMKAGNLNLPVLEVGAVRIDTGAQAVLVAHIGDI